ncbi:hypothetical protein TYRP_020118 [Tyrophagus putrescentiae]|nr:hypothetical protein TYRP_020118 [Tyrophagus putrescentiae]
MSFWSPMLCLSTTTLITRLHNLNNSSSSSLVSATSCTENITRKRAHLWAAKLAAYFLIFLLIFRMFLVSLTKLDCTSGERACMTEHPFWLVNPTILIVVHRYAYVVNASIFQSLCLIGLWVLFLDYYMNFRLNGVLLEATYAHFYLDIYSKPLRCRLYVYSNACDVLVVVLNTVIMLIAASFFTALALMVYQNYYAVSPDHISSFQYAFVLFDLLTFGYTIWNCMRMAIFAVHIILHSWLEWLMRRFNGRLVSPLAYTGITANVVVNLVLVGSLLFRPQRRHSHRLPLGASTLAVLIIIAQVMISLVATAGLTAISSRLYRSDRLLYRLQLALAGMLPEPIRKACLSDQAIIRYLNREDVQRAIHVDADRFAAPDNSWALCSALKENYLQYDYNYNSNHEHFKTLLENKIAVALYNGDANFTCHYSGAKMFLGLKAVGEVENLTGKNSGRFFGTVQQYQNNLNLAVFRNASHMVPVDEPKGAQVEKGGKKGLEQLQERDTSRVFGTVQRYELAVFYNASHMVPVDEPKGVL